MKTLEKEIREKIIAGEYDYPIMITIGNLIDIVPGIQEAIDEREAYEAEELRKAELERKQELKLMRKKKKTLSDIRKSKEVVVPLAELERLLILEALKKAKGNTELAAKALGISERTLFRKYIEYGINHKEFEGKEKKKESSGDR